MRNTIQRQMILQEVASMHNHPTAEDVYLIVHKKYPSISKATVYRNLHQLVQNGSISSVLLPDSPERFDERLQQHYHFVCKKCNKIIDIDMENLKNINATVQNSYGFQVDGHDIIFKGICLSCNLKSKD